MIQATLHTDGRRVFQAEQPLLSQGGISRTPFEISYGKTMRKKWPIPLVDDRDSFKRDFFRVKRLAPVSVNASNLLVCHSYINAYKYIFHGIYQITHTLYKYPDSVIITDFRYLTTIPTIYIKSKPNELLKNPFNIIKDLLKAKNVALKRKC